MLYFLLLLHSIVNLSLVNPNTKNGYNTFKLVHKISSSIQSHSPTHWRMHFHTQLHYPNRFLHLIFVFVTINELNGMDSGLWSGRYHLLPRLSGSRLSAMVGGKTVAGISAAGNNMELFTKSSIEPATPLNNGFFTITRDVSLCTFLADIFNFESVWFFNLRKCVFFFFSCVASTIRCLIDYFCGNVMY